MDRALGLLLLSAYIVGIVGLAAAVTFATIRVFPTQRTPKGGKPADAAEGPEDGKPERKPSGNGAQSGGRLYRRSKRRP